MGINVATKIGSRAVTSPSLVTLAARAPTNAQIAIREYTSSATGVIHEIADGQSLRNSLPGLYGPAAVYHFPYPTFRIYIDSMRILYQLSKLKRHEANAWNDIDAYLAANVGTAQSEITSIVANDRVLPTLGRMATTGLLLIGAGAALGSLAGPIGTAIGAAVGALIALILVLIPFDKLTFLGNWGTFVDQLTVTERLLLVAHMHDVMDAGRDAESLPRTDPWRMLRATDAFLEHSIYQGGDVLALFAFQDLCHRDWCPAPPDVDHDPVAIYARAVVASVLDDGDTFDQSHLYHDVMGGNGSAWMRSSFPAYASTRAADIRAQARPLAATMNNLPVTSWLAQSVLDTENQLLASQVQTFASQNNPSGGGGQ